MKRSIVLLALLTTGCSTWDVNAGDAVTSIFRPDYNRHVECAKKPWPWIWDAPTETCIELTEEQQATYIRNGSAGGIHYPAGGYNPAVVYTPGSSIMPLGQGFYGFNRGIRY